MDWYFRKTSTNNHVNGYEIEQLPIIISSDKTAAVFDKIVNKIIHGKKTGTETIHLEHQIDVIVYHLYDLNYQEACVIDNDLKIEDYEQYKI